MYVGICVCVCVYVFFFFFFCGLCHAHAMHSICMHDTNAEERKVTQTRLLGGLGKIIHCVIFVESSKKIGKKGRAFVLV